MKLLKSLILIPVMIFLVSGCAKKQPSAEAQFQQFVTDHVAKVKPLYIQANKASWDAATSGDPNDYKRDSELSFQLSQIYCDPNDFALLKDFRQSGKIKDPLLARQLEVLYNAYLSNQIEPEMLKLIIDLGKKIEKNFSTFRGKIEGQEVTDNEIKEILKKENDPEKRKLAWLASKQVGPVINEDLIKLIKLRNEAAKQLGFENYHTMVLTTGEQSVEELDKIFEELYELTNEPFKKLKNEMDQRLAYNYGKAGFAVDELMPWHYHDPFFQESPIIYELNLDSFYEDKDVKELAVQFYTGLGMPVDQIIAHSDLYEREGKNPHAFCTDIDRQGDVRILCNLKNNETWMETILHELGHSIYDYYHDENVPFLLREPAHIFTTEAVAMFFGRLSRNPTWMQEMLNLTDEQRAEMEETAAKYIQLKQLVFARWAMVMYNFEKELYANPDQDLNKLWWDMVEKYQFVKRPPDRDMPDWAAKIHFSTAPCYYHNYLLGELLASQFQNYLVTKVLGLESDEDVSYINQEQVGQFFRDKVFEVGNKYRWDEMIERATGEPLTAKYFVAEFID